MKLPLRRAVESLAVQGVYCELVSGFPCWHGRMQGDLSELAGPMQRHRASGYGNPPSFLLGLVLTRERNREKSDQKQGSGGLGCPYASSMRRSVTVAMAVKSWSICRTGTLARIATAAIKQSMSLRTVLP